MLFRRILRGLSNAWGQKPWYDSCPVSVHPKVQDLILLASMQVLSLRIIPTSSKLGLLLSWAFPKDSSAVCVDCLQGCRRVTRETQQLERFKLNRSAAMLGGTQRGSPKLYLKWGLLHPAADDLRASFCGAVFFKHYFQASLSSGHISDRLPACPRSISKSF